MVKETLIRIQFEKDLSRFRASRQHLSAAMVSTEMLEQRTISLREMNKADFDEVAGLHHQAFTRTHLFQSVRPTLEKYYATCCVGGGPSRH